VTPKVLRTSNNPILIWQKHKHPLIINKIGHKCKYIKYNYGHPKVKYNSGCSHCAMDGTIYNSITIINIIEICFKQLASAREI
jgi:hypothetical protein